MKTLKLIAVLIAVSILAVGSWGTFAFNSDDYNSSAVVAKKKIKKTRRRLNIKKERENRSRRSKGMRTRFAIKVFDSVEANQILLFSVN